MKWSTFEESTYENTLWCKVIIQIRENATGEIVEFEDKTIFKEDENAPSTYFWSDGNFACDCNRRDAFHKDNENDDCGDGEYSVNVLHPETRYAAYREFGSVTQP